MNSCQPAPPSASEIALKIVDRIPAMVAYWDRDQQCRFANEAYRTWFGVPPDQMLGITMLELLGPLYYQNLRHIEAALRGEPQLFERRIPLPDGSIRDTIATYTPDVVGGLVRGFFVHVADVTTLKRREEELHRTIRERDEALAEVRELRGFLPICSHCKSIRDEHQRWVRMEAYITERSRAQFSHTICPDCVRKHYPEVADTADPQA